MKLLLFCLSFFSLALHGAQTPLVVTVPGDTNPTNGGNTGDLRYTLNYINLNPSTDGYSITFSLGSSNVIQLNGMLPIINLFNPAPTIVSIDGTNGTHQIVINGQSQYRGFFAWQGDITLSNLSFQDMTALGGSSSGGGGGMGAGSALYVHDANVTIENLSFANCKSMGGDSNTPPMGVFWGGGGMGGNGGGSPFSTTEGGGGGLGGNGGDAGGNGGGGGGGIGLGASTNSAAGGAGNASSGSNGIAIGNGTASGGNAYNGGTGGDNGGGGGGGDNGGGGGGGGINGSNSDNSGNGAFGGVGGGGGGGNGENVGGGNGGNGGFGGGGGGAAENVHGGAGYGGNGGFGGGAGASNSGTYAQAGFGGGGGANNPGTNPGGIGGGEGGAGFEAGGGGAGFGGAIFVEVDPTNSTQGTLTINGSLTTTGNSVTGGSGNTNGAGAGADLFLMSSTTPYVFNTDTTLVFEGGIQDDSLLSLPSGNGYTPGNGPGIILQKTGTGTMTLSGTNAFTAAITISQGVLNFQNASVSGIGGTIVVDAGAELDLQGGITFNSIPLQLSGMGVNGGALSNVSGNNAYPGSVTLVANTTMDAVAGTLTLGGAIGETAAGTALTKTGAGEILLEGASSYTGGTTISAGTLALGSGGTLDSAGSVTLMGTGVFDISNSGANQTIGDLIGSSSTSSINLGSETLTFGTADNETYQGMITGSGSIVKQGSGTETLSGTNAFTRGTIIAQGILNIENGAALGTSGTVVVDAGAELDLQGGITVNSLPLQLSGTGVNGGALSNVSGNNAYPGTVTLFANTTIDAVAGTLTLAGSIGENTAGRALTKTGAGEILLQSANSYTGGTTISAGTLALGSGGTLDSAGSVTLMGTAVFDISNSGANQTIGDLIGSSSTSSINLGSETLTFGTAANETYQGMIIGSGSIVKQGTGTETFSGTNAYTGGTTISQGVLNIQNGSALGTSGTVVVDAGAELDLQGGITVNSHPLHLSGTGVNGGALSNVSGNNAYPGAVTLFANTTMDAVAGTLTLGGAIGETAAGTALTKTGAGEILLQGVNSYTGGTTISAGTLALGSGGALDSTGSVTLMGTAVFDISNSGANQTIGDLIGSSSTSSVNLGSQTLTFGTADNEAYQGIISGNGGSIVKQGSGAETLSGTNSFTGLTTVMAGELTINSPGQIVGGASVQDGSTLSGTGTVGGSVDINGTLSPGDGAPGETLTVHGDLTLASTATTDIIINPSVSSEIIQTAGITSLGGTLSVTLIGSYQADYTFTILDATAAGTTPIGSFNSVLFSRPPTSYSIHIQNDLVKLLLSFSAPILSTSGLSENALAVANYLNELEAANSLADLFTALEALPYNQYVQALNAISPSRNAFTTFMSQNTLFSCSRLVSSHLATWRLFEEREQYGTLAGGIREERLLAEAGGLLHLEKIPSSDAIWMTGFGTFASQKAQRGDPAFKARSEGVLIGADYGKDQGIIGASIGYALSSIEDDASLGSGQIKYVVAALYGTAFIGDGYLDVGVWGGYNHFDNERNIFFTGFNTSAKSSHLGYQVMPHLGFGYFFCHPFWRFIEPFASFDYAVNFEQSLSETKGGVLDMDEKRRNSSMLRSEIGVKGYTEIRGRKTLYVFKPKLSYINKTPFQKSIFSGLVGFPTNLTVETLINSQNLISPSIELFVQAPRGIFGSISYEGEFGSGYKSNECVGRVGIYF